MTYTIAEKCFTFSGSKMSSRQAAWKQRLKEVDPAREAELRRKESERSKRRRLEKKLKWLTGPLTRADIEKKTKEDAQCR